MVALEEKQHLLQAQDPRVRKRAFEGLVLEYQEVLYYHIRRIVIDHDDTDDVLQNTLLKAWRNLGKFRAESSIKTWMYRIATNEALSFLKKKKRQGHEEIEDLQNDLRHSLHAERGPDGDEIQFKLQAAILTLPDRQRMVFNMRYFQEMKYDEISEVLEVSVGALKASYHHAAKKIETYLTS
ncbi:MAG: RNA polymerase sigma factor [Bacteroidota bacterium]